MDSSLLLKTVPLVVANRSTPLELIADNFTFDDDITPAQIGMLRERYRFAFARIAACQNLNANERASLIQAFRRAISHGIETRPNVNASTTINGSRILVNFNVLFPQGVNEIAQTLIHEMMHCAGFTHPDRRAPPDRQSCANPNPDVFDCPFDNGQYYGTPPLRAELCIVGNQSDLRLRFAAKAAIERCTVSEDGVCTIHSA